MMKITDIIIQIEADKKSKRITPNHAMLLEVINIALRHGVNKDEVDKEIERLSKEKKIITGHTINDKFIKTIQL